MGPRELVVGIWAACATPARLGDDLQGLLAGSRSDPDRVASDRAAEASVSAARLMLRVLARLPGNRWRNTCLYRSAAECLALRRLGLPARLCLGAEEDRGSPDRVTAHAWVEVDGVGPTYREEPRAGMTRFVPRGTAAQDAH
jgi:hypothetical protein